MARGCESKSVESQIESAESRKQQKTARRKTPEEIQRESVIEELRLSRTRVVRDLAAATNPRYREMLEASLKHLDARIAEESVK